MAIDGLRSIPCHFVDEHAANDWGIATQHSSTERDANPMVRIRLCRTLLRIKMLARFQNRSRQDQFSKRGRSQIFVSPDFHARNHQLPSASALSYGERIGFLVPL